MSGTGWFADVSDEAPTSDYPWQPCLETGTGHTPCFDVWFKTREECERYIREDVIPYADHPDYREDRA